MPPGWTPKSTAPAAFDTGQALGTLITGEADNWLSDWLHLLNGEVFNTANVCEHVDLDPPGLDVWDFTAFIPSGALSTLGMSAASATTLYALKDKLAKYALARIGRAYCEFTAAEAAAGSTPANGGAAWVLHVPAGTMYVELTQVGYYVGGVLQAWPDGTIEASYDGASIAIGDNLTLNRAWLHWDSWSNPLALGYDLSGPRGLSWWAAVGKPVGGLPANAEIRFTWRLVPYPLADPEPPDYVAPHMPTFTDVPSLAPEMANLERKLELVRDLLTYLVGVSAPPAVIIDPAIPAADPITGDPTFIELRQHKGIVVTVSGVNNNADEWTGVPVKYHRVGRVTFGTTEAWFAPIDISTNPMVIAPIPPFVTRVSVWVVPPQTAVVSTIS